MNSLKDQLLKAGLTNTQAVKNVAKKKQAKLKKKDRGGKSESSKLAESVLQTKMIRDKELNKIRQDELDKKAELAQIKQLVEISKIDKEEGEQAYNFQHSGKIKTIYVTAVQQLQLIRNQISIVALNANKYELVPRLVAEKIAIRDDSYVVFNETEAEFIAEDDPYADYKIPDDLVW